MKLFVSLPIFTLLIVNTPLSSFAQEAKEPIVCQGDKVEYLTEERMTIAEGNVIITHKDMKLTCDKATIYLDTKDAEAFGNVTLYQDESIFQAEEVSYNFETEKGTLIKGEAKIEGELATRFWYGKGEKVEKVGPKEFHIRPGYITTCDLDPPHYRIQAKKIKIYLDDKVTAKHVLFYIGNCPVFYLPFYSRSLKDRRTRITIIPGHSKEWGTYLLSRWGYYFNENSKGYISLDWREKRGYAEGLDYMYRTREFGEGSLRTYYLNDLDKQDPLEERNERERYLAQLRHRWQINGSTLLVAEYHRLKDKDIIKDFFEKEYEEQHQPESFISITRSKPTYSLGLKCRKRTNRFYSVVERLPELKLDIPNLRVAKTKFYLQTQTSLTNLNYKIVSQVGTGEEDISLTEDRDVVRFDTYNELSYVTKLFGWLNVTPYSGIRETWYSKDTAGQENLNRTIYYGGLGLSTRFFKIYDIKSELWQINKLRHLVEPGISYNYIHEPTVGTSRILQFDSIDAISDKNAITLTLENKLQTKRDIGGQPQKVDLVDLVVSTDYFLEEDKISNIKADLELRPYSWLSCEADCGYNYYRGQIETFNVDLVASRARWQLGLGHRYDFTDKEMEEKEYSLQRDLHCWIGEVTVNIKDTVTIWVVFRLKAFPEIPFEFKTSYHRRRSG